MLQALPIASTEGLIYAIASLIGAVAWPDSRAGYTLLKAMRERGDLTQFVIYAGSNAAEHKQLARERGALGSTNSPQELLDLVLRAVERVDTAPVRRDRHHPGRVR